LRRVVQHRFPLNTTLPWNGFLFRVVENDKSKIVLEPIGLTHKFQKRLEKEVGRKKGRKVVTASVAPATGNEASP
jgi:hypothetical protein